MLGVCCDEKVKKMMLTAKNIVREKEREGERKWERKRERKRGGGGGYG